MYFTIENKWIKVKIDQMQTYMTEYLTPAFVKYTLSRRITSCLKKQQQQKNSEYEIKNKSASFFSLVNKNILNL